MNDIGPQGIDAGGAGGIPVNMQYIPPDAMTNTGVNARHIFRGGRTEAKFNSVLYTGPYTVGAGLDPAMAGNMTVGGSINGVHSRMETYRGVDGKTKFRVKVVPQTTSRFTLPPSAGPAAVVAGVAYIGYRVYGEYKDQKRKNDAPQAAWRAREEERKKSLGVSGGGGRLPPETEEDAQQRWGPKVER